MQSLSHPFRFINGRAPTVDDRTDAFSAQMIAAVVKTGKGELPLNPDYGTRQPEFASLDRSGLAYSVTSYYPLISINKISEVVDKTTGDVQIKVEFTTNESIG